MSDTGCYIVDEDGTAHVWGEDGIVIDLGAKQRRTQDTQLQKYTVSMERAEIDALLARVRSLEAQAARDKAALAAREAE